MSFLLAYAEDLKKVIIHNVQKQKGKNQLKKIYPTNYR